MSVDYFLYAPEQDVCACVGSDGLSGVQSYPGTKESINFVRWAIDENIKGIVFLNEHEMDAMRERLGYDDPVPRDPPKPFRS
jgi:hypothetical protein